MSLKVEPLFFNSPAPDSLLHQIEENAFEGTELKGSDSEFNSSRQLFLGKLLSSLDNHFEDVDEGIIQATSVFSFRTWPDKDNSEGTNNQIKFSY